MKTGAYFLVILIVLFFSCKKEQKQNDLPKKPDELPYIGLTARVFLYDKIADTTLFNSNVKYLHDSLQVYASENGPDYFDYTKSVAIDSYSYPGYIDIGYVNRFVTDISVVNEFRFDLSFAILWNSTTGDTLRVIKDNDTDISFYKNGQLDRTIEALKTGEEIQEIKFYK